jgi:hypothetical protein
MTVMQSIISVNGFSYVLHFLQEGSIEAFPYVSMEPVAKRRHSIGSSYCV